MGSAESALSPEMRFCTAVLMLASSTGAAAGVALLQPVMARPSERVVAAARAHAEERNSWIFIV
jgi:hypothetical protein